MSEKHYYSIFIYKKKKPWAICFLACSQAMNFNWAAGFVHLFTQQPAGAGGKPKEIIIGHTKRLPGLFFSLSLSFNSSSLVAGSKMAAVLIPMRSRQFHLSISFLIADAAEWPLKPNSLEIS